jgi:aspartate-semialdehyde dehydrogenase
MEVETRRILGLPNLHVSATCVRVPVFVGHAEAINMTFEIPLSSIDARRLLEAAPGVRVVDERKSGGYITPLEAAGTDPVYVSRIREDQTAPNALWIWNVSDNVRKGAALNAVQIAEALVQRKIPH